MSIDSEDSPLEQALRSDLPTDEAAQRMRRRLLAAGIAVGNGMAVTTAAAAGATPGVLAGALAKVGALSWGVKLGLAAAVAIPTVGLVAERLGEPRAAVTSVAAARAPKTEPTTVTEPAAPSLQTPAAAVAATPPEQRAMPVSRSVASPEVKEPPSVAEATRVAPSQRAFEASDPAPAATGKAAQSTLAEETRLLDAAFAELSAGNRGRAAELVAEHQARFPTGLLGRERERAKARLHEISRGD